MSACLPQIPWFRLHIAGCSLVAWYAARQGAILVSASQIRTPMHLQPIVGTLLAASARVRSLKRPRVLALRALLAACGIRH